MSVIENKNFTNFQNVNLKGTDGHAGAIQLVAVGGDGKTISFVQGSGEAQYLTVAEGLRLGSGYISFQSRNTEATLSVSASLEAPRAYTFPNNSGVLTIGGSFLVQLPSIAERWYSTTVTVAGIRTTDALVVDLSEKGTYVYGEQGTKYIKIGAIPNNGSVTLSFHNLGNATGYIELVGSYAATRS